MTRYSVIPRSPPISDAFYDAHRDTADLFLIINLRVTTGVLHFKNRPGCLFIRTVFTEEFLYPLA